MKFLESRLESQSERISQDFSQKGLKNISEIHPRIKNTFAEAVEANNESLYTPQCLVKKLIRDNLILIVIGGISLTLLVTFTVS